MGLGRMETAASSRPKKRKKKKKKHGRIENDSNLAGLVHPGPEKALHGSPAPSVLLLVVTTIPQLAVHTSTSTMPPALGLGRALTRSRRGVPAQICLFCSLSSSLSSSSSSSPAALLRGRRRPFLPSTTTTITTTPKATKPVTTPHTPRHQSTSTPTTVTTTTTSSSPSSNPRQDLHRALLDLQAHAPNHVNLARLQLALRNLSQPPGRESVRVAFLAVSGGGGGGGGGSTSTRTARRLLRLALADPLAPAAPAWERRLEEAPPGDSDRGAPLVVRVVAGARGSAGAGGDGEQQLVGQEEGEEGDGSDRPRLTAVGRERAIPEVRVSSPGLDGGNLELLVAGAGPLAAVAAQVGNGDVEGGVQAVEDAVLVPAVEVAATTAGHVAPIATPVHMAVLVGDGLLGAASILSLPILEGRDMITAAVNFTKIGEQDLANCPIVRVNVDAGSEGLELFRADVSNAMKYEALWSEANVGRISEWLRRNAMPSDEGVTKRPVRNLISSLLRNTRAVIQEREARELSAESRPTVAPDVIAGLDRALSEWAQNAHEELQQKLDDAFAGRPWSKLSWWKLIWRADDVGMVTSEMVALRFLPEAEQRIIYLAGRIEEAGVVEGQQGHPLYAGPAVPQPSTGVQRQDTVTPNSVGRWPTHIPFTRNYLQEKTVPALQALAQRLVVQSASLAGLTTALAGLSYFSALGAYECGAIAALGIVVSLRRLQKKWDAAREYWEGEVREEGRKAIRASEASVAEVLSQAGKPREAHGNRSPELEELRKAEEIIKRAEDALARMK